MNNRRYRVGVIGLGNMGSRYLETLVASDRWEVVSVCDLSEGRLAWARGLVAGVETTRDSRDVTDHADIDVVGIFTLADDRPQILEESLRRGKHVLAEKPIAAGVAAEKELLRTIEASDRLVAVNLFNRNAWYHEDIQSFISQGQIGELAVINISHQTPGLMPTEGHQPEGPPFHDCGMHYVDVARWYAGSDYDRWHAQGIRMWSWPDPWWVNVHGQFKSGVVFSITQGFTYGQLAETSVVQCGIEVIGTKGVVRMQHDFQTVQIQYHGVSYTERKEGPYGGKKLDVMCERFARALETGDACLLPTARDSVVASAISQEMLDAATQGAAPCIGTPQEMDEILAHRERYQGRRVDDSSNRDDGKVD